VTVLGTGTVALMPRAAWLRHWLYPGQHLLAARGGGGRPGPEPVPDPPDGGRLADAGAGTDVLAVGLPSWSEEGPDGEHDEVPVGAAGSVGLPAGM